jgi:phytoene dehydrogenase-like protein
MASYDAIVIGAGIAGMMAATELSHKGRKVLVLEHNHQPGGLMSGIWRKGFYFDVGCQSFENMDIVFPLLEQYGLGHVAKFQRARYRLKMPNIDVVVQSLEQTRQEFKRCYPESAEGFDRVFDTHEMTSAFIRRMFTADGIPFVQKESPLAFARWFARALPWARSLKTLMLDDFEDWYKRVLPESGARDLLSTCGYSRMNVFVASAFWHLWAEDYWYPEGGYQKWFDTWQQALEARGVEFKFKSLVTKFERTGKRVTAVVNKKGERFEASQFIYAGDYKKAVYDLIGAENYSRHELSKLEGAKHSDPLVCVYLGLNFPREELKKIVKSSHIFYFPDYGCRTELDINDPDAHRKAFLEVTAHCIDDASLAPEGKSSIVLQAFTRCDWLDHWTSKGKWDERSLEYKDLKRKVGDQIIGTFEGIFPDVRKYIEYSDVGSPLTAHRFTRNWVGGSCGFELNWRNYPFLNPLAHTKTPLENVHMAGHFTVWPGAVPTAALSGKIASLRANKEMGRA